LRSQFHPSATHRIGVGRDCLATILGAIIGAYVNSYHIGNWECWRWRRAMKMPLVLSYCILRKLYKYRLQCKIIFFFYLYIYLICSNYIYNYLWCIIVHFFPLLSRPSCPTLTLHLILALTEKCSNVQKNPSCYKLLMPPRARPPLLKAWPLRQPQQPEVSNSSPTPQPHGVLVLPSLHKENNDTAMLVSMWDSGFVYVCVCVSCRPKFLLEIKLGKPWLSPSAFFLLFDYCVIGHLYFG
jgi:hypothetical protein